MLISLAINQRAAIENFVRTNSPFRSLAVLKGYKYSYNLFFAIEENIIAKSSAFSRGMLFVDCYDYVLCDVHYFMGMGVQIYKSLVISICYAMLVLFYYV